MKIFLDIKCIDTEIISIGLVSEDGRTFYGESIDLDKTDCIHKREVSISGEEWEVSSQIAIDYYLEKWLDEFEEVELWLDNDGYGLGELRNKFNCHPYDIKTLAKSKGIELILEKTGDVLEDAKKIKEEYEIINEYALKRIYKEHFSDPTALNPDRVNKPIQEYQAKTYLNHVVRKKEFDFDLEELRNIVSNHKPEVLIIDIQTLKEIKEHFGLINEGVNKLYGYQVIVEDGNSGGCAVIMSEGEYRKIKPSIIDLNFWELIKKDTE